jgi:hypothetical protein
MAAAVDPAAAGPSKGSGTLHGAAGRDERATSALVSRAVKRAQQGDRRWESP